MSRRDFLKLASLFTTSLTTAVALGGCQRPEAGTSPRNAGGWNIVQIGNPGGRRFLWDLRPAAALVGDSFARTALEQVGGPQVFGLPADLTRTETF